MYNKQESPKLNKFDNKQYVLVNKQGEKLKSPKFKKDMVLYTTSKSR
jgi:hypothetical protein